MSGYFKANLNNCVRYHNLSPTSYVVSATDNLCEVMNIDEDLKIIMLTAAWFHDLGFTVVIEGHESAGASLAEDFLVAKGIAEDEIAFVKSCILTTSYPQRPAIMLEEILYDVDLLYLGESRFLRTSEALRTKWELTKRLTYTDEEWCSQNIRFLIAHRFHTTYGRSIVEMGKQRNTRCLEDSLQGIQNVELAKLLNEALMNGALTERIRRTGNASSKAGVLNALKFQCARA